MRQRTNGKPSEQRATERKRDGREDEQETRNRMKTVRCGENGREMSKEVRVNCDSRTQQKSEPNHLAVTPEQTEVNPWEG